MNRVASTALTTNTGYHLPSLTASIILLQIVKYGFGILRFSQVRNFTISQSLEPERSITSRATALVDIMLMSG
jgi:hypothetical protein